jgi:hypothetical protein
MKPTTIPMICGTALAAMSAAALSHWWFVEEIAAVAQQGLPLAAPVAMELETPVAAPPAAEPIAPPAPPLAKHAPTPVAEGSQKDFYETLIARMESLQNQNRDLLDQMAETNRDLMKLEFRVDTHSESFRPMPVSEEGSLTNFDEGPGVLPPRAEPVILLPFDE